MKNFKMITEEDYYNENFNIYENIVDNVYTTLQGNISEEKKSLEESIINCESPIEQLLSIELERLNIKNIFSFNPYIDVIDIYKQEEIICDKNKYRIDFLIPVEYKNQEVKVFAIECDGYEFHQKNKEQVERDNKRQRDLQKNGYEIIRFSGTEIWHKPTRCAREILNIILSYCKYIND